MYVRDTTPREKNISIGVHLCQSVSLFEENFRFPFSFDETKKCSSELLKLLSREYVMFSNLNVF